jgi:alanine transaminase
MVAPPRPGDESFDLYCRERDAILGTLKRKARLLEEGINGIDGLSVDIPQGAMYAFVRLTLGVEKGGESRSREEQLEQLSKREFAYCLALLEQTGICVVPGTGFGQTPGTLHFRTTFLPPEEEMESLVKKLKEFHEQYMSVEQPVH